MVEAAVHVQAIEEMSETSPVTIAVAFASAAKVVFLSGVSVIWHGSDEQYALPTRRTSRAK